VAEAGEEAGGMEDITAAGVIGTLATTDGTADGVGGVAVLIRGGCSCRPSFQFQCHTQLMVTVLGTGTGRDTATVQVTGTEDTDFTDRIECPSPRTKTIGRSPVHDLVLLYELPDFRDGPFMMDIPRTEYGKEVALHRETVLDCEPKIVL
jgi:hypothetical protein